ncbi:DUF1217 domain-containing protein [Ruegeria sp. 2012CJ41-6]|uniref:DUF1217 domain-containing protein n=1 Tax=Ruegeria spongiae TaxID=2942209 RepID=A0ABT0Q4D0_9RHOB|nr:DUF1217 domain-containing protein [Ruegeria spongiae]MCL6284670.1 DUF1217 domain-containing protein [Ruegeria spongiae]
MSFRPVVPVGGIVGWQFLQRTQEHQREALSASPLMKREAEHFLKEIGNVTSAEELVADRTLLKVALGAFGLESDLNNRFFVQKILEDGTSAQDALANRLADKRYRAFSDAFGFGPGAIQKTSLVTSMEDVVEKYQSQAFETAIGESDESMRISLYAQHELVDIATGEGTDTTKWLNIIGLPPLRTMFETALGLPRSFASVDLDKQVEVFRDRFSSATGLSDLSALSDPNAMEKTTHLYLARAQIASFASQQSSAAIALSLLQS